MQPYGKEVAETIIKCRQNTVWRLGVDGEHVSDDLVIKDDGVFPNDERPSNESEFDACTWRPACELSGQAGRKLREKPALPIPFNENELAAFFLHGWGWYVRDSFGSWDDGPDDSVFDEIDHLERGEVKDAVTGAFQAYRTAECVVGQFDNTLACEAQRLDSAFWKAAVSLRTAEQSEALRIAQKKADEAESAWRKKMVNQLLTVEQVPVVDSHSVEQVPPMPAVAPASDGPAPVQTHNESAPAQTTSAPVVAASDGPAKRRTWRDVAWPYMVDVFNSGRYATAKQFYNDLEKMAGAESPFDRGTDVNRGSLFVRDVSGTVSLKTVQNAWGELKESCKRT